MAIEITCPKCSKKFTSEMNLEFHHKSQHEPYKWTVVFEDVLLQTKKYFPEKASAVDSAMNIVVRLKNDECSREKKAKVKIELKQYIEKIKAKTKGIKQ